MRGERQEPQNVDCFAYLQYTALRVRVRLRHLIENSLQAMEQCNTRRAVRQRLIIYAAGQRLHRGVQRFVDCDDIIVDQPRRIETLLGNSPRQGVEQGMVPTDEVLIVLVSFRRQFRIRHSLFRFI